MSVLSCQDNEDLLTENIELNASESEMFRILSDNNVSSKNGVLFFPSFESFNNTNRSFDVLSNNNDLELTTNFYAKMGYISFDYIYQDALKQISEASDTDELNELKGKFSNIVNIEMFSPEIVFQYITPFLNKDRIINIEGAFYHYGVHGVGLSLIEELNLDNFKEADIARNSTEEIFYYEPQQQAGSRNCTNHFYDWSDSGKRAGRSSYDAEKDIVYGRIENCGFKTTINIFTGETTTEWKCDYIQVPINVVLSFNVAGLAFKKSWFGWNTYSTSLNLKGDIVITADGEQYDTSWDESCGSCSNRSHRASWYPNAATTSVGGATVEEVNLFFDTRGLPDGKEIIFNCN